MVSGWNPYEVLPTLTVKGYVSPRNAAWEKRHNYSSDEGGTVELYNLREDRGQRENLVAQDPHRVKRMQSLLAKVRSASGTRTGLNR